MADQDEFNRGIILPTIIKQLKSILQQYPDDGQILKELIQNSEDAGARKVIFLLDSTSYSARLDKLHHEGLALYQGPALYVYNDAVFTADDWKGIRMLNDSVKEKDPMKVGRFGLGFKSVFHMTDLPSICSGNGVGFLDPHEQFFHNEDKGKRYPTSSYLWDLKKSKEEIRRLEDQFLPFQQELFGLTNQTFSNGYFNGTVFRFPIRIEGMNSNLCDTKYDATKVRELFRSLETDAHIMLLFLKSLECIEVYEKTSETESPQKLMAINIANDLKEEVKAKRLQFVNQIERHKDGSIIDPVSIIYPMNVEFQNHLNKSQTETSKWIISQYYAGKSELDSEKEICESLGLLPWVGVALKIEDNSETSSYLMKPKGHIFCFLPLPLEETSPTGLRVHVHGYFAVDSNRKHLKWPTADQNVNQLTDKALIWNKFLVNKILVKALVKLALHVATPENRLQHDLIFNIIPDQLTPQWKLLADEFYKQLPSLNIFHSSASGGQWMNSRNAFFDNMEDETELQTLIRRILLANQIGLVSAPLFLRNHFENQITQKLICESLKTVGLQDKISLNDGEKLLVLNYLICNLKNLEDLIGVNLLPLEDGSWTDFKRCQHQEPVYIDSNDHPKSLLPGQEKLFLRSDIQMFEAHQNLAKLNITQLVILSESSIPSLLRSIFPDGWKTKALADLCEAPHLSSYWIERLWDYLNRYFSSDLQDFEDLHILPVGDGQVIPLNGETALMVSSHCSTTLEPNVKDVLRKLGIQIVDVLPSPIRNHPCVLGKFIFLPNTTNEGIFGAIRKLQGSKPQDMDYMELNNSDKKVLQKFLTSGLAGKSSDVIANRDILLSMPIFQTLEGSGSAPSHFVSLTAVRKAAPTDAIPVNLPQRLLDLSEILLQELAEQLEIQRFTTVALLEDLVFPAIAEGIYGKEDVIRLVSFIFDNFSHFQKSSCTFLSSVSNIRFIEKLDGSLVTARDVFDHCDQTLQLLFAGDDLFPVKEFTDSKYIQFLRVLRIKGPDSVTALDLLHVVIKLNLSENPDLICADILLMFLENHSGLLDVTVHSNNNSSESLLVVLSRMRWIKCELHRPENYPNSLAFASDSNYAQALMLPTELYSSRFGSVIGSVRPTINTEDTPNIARRYGWLKEPSIGDVLKHLLNVVSSYQQDQKLRFQFTVNDIYKHMNDAITQIECSELTKALHDVDWVWNGEGFISHRKVVRTQPFMDLRPHVFQLSNDFDKFTGLWDCFQLQEKCNYIQVLKDIKSLHENSNYDKVHVDRDLRIAIEILRAISISDQKHEMIPELLVPIKSSDGRLHLREIMDVTYSDQATIQDDTIESNEFLDSIHLVHPFLPVETAKALNIHGIINRMLGTEDLDFESYGQSEPLTTRISNILRDYPDGLAVLKELVQNADDAGATEVKFMYDERQNTDARNGLIDKGMSDLQGPAIWAYNNTVFTSQDFSNLIRLSGATKKQDRSKIGRFGLGFNAVYNLTDVPSLVSQNHVVFLDPHTSFLGDAIRDKMKPGIKLDIQKNHNRVRLLSGQFKPYNGLFGCDFTPDSKMISYDGTLFRFPLRTQMQACTSEISKKHYSSDEVLELLKLLVDSSHQFFLFTQHIRKISVYHLSSDSSSPYDMKKWFEVEKKVDRILRSLDQTLPQTLEGDISMGQECGILDSVNKILFKPSSDDDDPQIECSFVIEVTSALDADVPDIMKMNATNDTTHWLTASCIGRRNSLAMAKKYAELGLTPVGGVAARLKMTNGGIFEPVNLVTTTEKCVAGDGCGLVFCFLPLPIRSCFPVHINGAFAVTSSRMHLHEKAVNDKTDIEGEWNDLLIADAIVQSYIILLEDLHKLCPDSDQYALWPVHKSLKEAGILHRLTDSLYSCICESNGPKLLKCKQLISIADCKFLEPQFRHQTGGVGITAQRTFCQLLPTEMADIPLLVVDTVKQTSAWDALKKRMVLRSSFFESIFIPAINVIEKRDRDVLVLYALFDSQLINTLRNVAFFPVKPQGKLRMCTEMVHPMSRLAILYDEENECFPADVSKNCGRNQKTRKKEDVYRKLVELGMKENELSWMEIGDRCLAIPDRPELMSERLPVLIQLMSSKTFPCDESDVPHVERIKRIDFLPTAKKPAGYPLKWAGDEIKFTSCENSYLRSEESLVSCSFPIIDERQTFDFKHTDLTSFLGLLEKPVHQKHLLLQLKNVIELADSHGVVSRLQQVQKEKVKGICKDVYKRLDRYAKENELSDELLDELKNMRSITLDKNGILTSMNPSRCAFELPVGDRLLPYLAKIPHSLTANDSLLRCLQVPQKFALTDYIGLLKSLHGKAPGKPLSDADVEVALCIVNQCLVRKTETCIKDIQLENLFIPNDKNILVPADKICYMDCLWFSADEYGDNDDDEEQEKIYLCHAKIPQYTARQLGLKTIREDTFEKYSSEMDFGQSERLVNRIKRILIGYPLGNEVLKEMLQNADDAGATKIHFINDRRELPAKRVFADKWKPMQGPALCIYNNKPFTKEDISGIQTLGEGSKSHDPTKTGQYGVGFNCVYHLTDAPTFLTQVVDDERVLCVFDPTCSFVPRATSTKPGKMMNRIERLKQKFPDVFKGYFEAAYGKTGGTMFRLPLRSEEIAKQSSLLNKVVTPDDVQGLFETFKRDMFESLLFLNSVEEIHLKEADSAGQLSTTYFVKAELSVDARQRRQSFKESVKHFAEALKHEKTQLENIPVKEVSYELITKDSEGHEDRWHIIQRIGFESAAEVSKELTAAYRRKDIGLLPRAGIAYRIDGTHLNTNRSKLFSFLPLPVTIDFPVHVNGQFALEYETRRSLWLDNRGGPNVEWNKCMMTNIVAPAYCQLLQERRDAICEAEDIKNQLFKYHLLFPSVAEQDLSYIRTLSLGVYKRIKMQNKAILSLKMPTENEVGSDKSTRLWMGPMGTDDTSWHLWARLGWKGIRGLNGITGHFDNMTPDVCSDPGVDVRVFTIETKPSALLKTLVECGFLVYDCPLTIHQNFKSAGVETELINPEAVVSFLSTYNKPRTLCQIKDLPRPISRTPIRDLNTLISLLQYCNGSTKLKQKLLGLPLQATADGFLHCFDSTSIKYEPRFRQIVPHIQGQFIDDSAFGTLGLISKYDVQLCKEFTIGDFAQVLQGVIPAATFHGGNKFADIKKMIAVFNDPNMEWLKSVWRFLSYCDDVKPLNNWCLLPVRFNGKNTLFPIHKYKCVTTFKKQTFPPRLRQTLQGIGLPEPIWMFDVTSSKYNSLLRETNDCETIIRGFEELIRCVSPDFNLDCRECIGLLQYFSENLDDWRDTPNAFNTIKQLPIFITVYNKRVRLWQNNVYIIPLDIPNTDMDSWTSTQGIVFLRSQNTPIDSLLKLLGCKALSKAEIYCNFIFMHFELLTPNGRHDHLRYVKDTLLVTVLEHDRPSLVHSLKHLRFLPASDGSLRCASEFYDNANEVFVVMEQDVDLPPSPFNSREWNGFLRTCGMISVVTPDMFLKYAKAVELRALSIIDKKLCKQSNVLVKHLFEGNNILSEACLKTLKSIAFVLPYSVDQEHSILHTQYGQRDEAGHLRFIPLRGAILSTFSTLVWSAQPILPSIASPLLSLSDGKCAKDLEIDDRPQCEIVARHTNQLCRKWVSCMQEFNVPDSDRDRDKAPDLGALASVLAEIYNFFTENLDCTNDDVYKSLRETPLILDTNRRLLLRADQVAEHLRPKDEISPFLVRIPSELIQFATLFKALGATEDATIDQYVMVLESIYANTKDTKLNPEDRTATLKAVGQLFKRLKKHDGQIMLQTELFLLGNDDRIHKSCDLVVDNSYGIRKRLPVFEKPFLIDLQKECNLRFSARQLESIIKNLPVRNQPSFLASIVKEEMSRDFALEESALTNLLQRKLHSDELKLGLLRLAHHRIATSEDFKEENISKALQNLNNVRVSGVNKIECYLVFKERRIEDSERQCAFFAEKVKSGDHESWNIYIDEKKMNVSYTAESCLYIQLVDIIQGITGNLPENAVAFLSCMLKCRPNTNEIDEVLDDFGIEQFISSSSMM